MVIGRRLSRCCCGWASWSRRTGGSRLGWPSLRRLNRSSRSSSLPPSQDPPSAPPRPGGKRSGRGRGGQPGHEGRHRRLLPPEQVDEVVEHWPQRCHSCAHVFGELERVDVAEPWRHQVAELPPIAVRVTEHRLHAVCCPECA
jgi:transposase